MEGCGDREGEVTRALKTPAVLLMGEEYREGQLSPPVSVLDATLAGEQWPRI